MARSAKSDVVAGVIPLVVALACASGIRAEPTITLEDAAARKPPQYTLVHEGRNVVVSGQVSIKPIRIGDVYHIAIQDNGHGLVLEGSSRVFSDLSPGDRVEAGGRLTQRAGLPVAVVSKLTKISTDAPPVEISLSPEEVQSLDRLGQLVITKGEIVEVGSNFGGGYIRIG